MKKFLYLILLALPFAFSSCSDDDKNLPNVSITLEFDDAVNVDGTIYAVQGTPFEIAGVKVVNNEADKAAFITSAAYYWDGYYLGSSYVEPYGFKFELPENISLGKHTLVMECPVAAVDKTLATAVVGYDVMVVESFDDIPNIGAETSTTVPQFKSDTK